MPESETCFKEILGRGFPLRKNLRYFERTIPLQRQVLSALGQLGGRVLALDVWEMWLSHGMKGTARTPSGAAPSPMRTWPTNSMSCRRAPWSSSGRRAQGKTTCARAIASRLERSFVEVLPSQRAEDPPSAAGSHQCTPKDDPGLPRTAGRQLVCATNLIRALDTELLHRGRFDCVIPIACPTARRPKTCGSASSLPSRWTANSSWNARKASPRRTLKYAARSTSQRALENVVYGNNSAGGLASSGTVPVREAVRKGSSTQDYACWP